jgi:hypothetical protein
MDQLDEAHDVTLLRSAKYQQVLRQYHGRRVRGQTFNVDDLVLRLVQSNKNRHKLSPPWEGPYIIAEVLRLGTYKLQTIDEKSSLTLGTSNNYVIFTPSLPKLFMHL